MDMGSLLMCTGASCWSYMALAYRIGHAMGGATDNLFSFSYSESGVLSLNFHPDRERPYLFVTILVYSTAKLAAPPGQRAKGSNTGPKYKLSTQPDCLC